jgi:hypothetical protein
LVQRVECGDIDASELFVGVSDLNSSLAKLLQSKKVAVSGVKAAAKAVTSAIDSHLTVKTK